MKKLEHMADRLAALGNPTRLGIFQLLVRAGKEGLSVNRIQSELDVPASTLSHHIKHLEMVGLISRERQGTTLLCKAEFPVMDSLLDFLTKECCSGV